MTTNYIVKTVKGKYAGTCPKCDLMLMAGEVSCGRCGATWEVPAKAQTLDGEIKQEEVEDVESTEKEE